MQHLQISKMMFDKIKILECIAFIKIAIKELHYLKWFVKCLTPSKNIIKIQNSAFDSYQEVAILVVSAYSFDIIKWFLESRSVN